MNTSLVVAVALTLVAASVEARGYVLSFDAFRNGTHPALLLQAFAWYALGIWIDYAALFVLRQSSLYVPELLSMLFMSATLIGIALLSGQFFTWRTSDQAVAVLVAFGLVWLAYRVE